MNFSVIFLVVCWAMIKVKRMEFVWEIRISSLYIHILYVKIRIAFEMDAMLYRMCSGELIGKWVLGSVFRVFKEIHSIFVILILVA